MTNKFITNNFVSNKLVSLLKNRYICCNQVGFI
mgnify:CR=1 FL=1